MTTDEISFSLAKNVEELRQKLNQTEQSINTLEHFAQRLDILLNSSGLGC